MEEKLTFSGGASYFIAVIIGLVAALLMLLLLSLAAAAVVYFSPISEEVLAQVALFIDGAAALTGGFMAAKSSGHRGLILGGVVGVILLALMLPLGTAGGISFWQSCICLLTALAGGVLGVR